MYLAGYPVSGRKKYCRISDKVNDILVDAFKQW